jgi:flagellar hook-basal body complex protein FliE
MQVLDFVTDQSALRTNAPTHRVTGPELGQGNDTPGGGLGTGGAPVPFSGVLHQAVDTLQQLDNQASEAVQGLLSGDGTDIHTAMIATQKASLAFDTALAVRNKAVGAYQQLMGMQF